MIGRNTPRRLHLLLTAFSIASTTGCAPAPPALPTGGGSPYAEFASAYAQAVEPCRGVRTFAGLLELSGRAAGSKLPRTRIEAGFAAPAQIRLEATAGIAFGRPIFILVAQQKEAATLILPRDKRVLTGEPAGVIIEALAGVALDADELRGIVSGCGPGVFAPESGRIYDNGWVTATNGEQTLWLRQMQGVWRGVAASRGPVQIRYDEFQSGRPTVIRIRTESRESGAATDLTIRVSDVDMNVPLSADVFQEPIPADAAPLTLDELRRAGPLGGPAKS